MAEIQETRVGDVPVIWLEPAAEAEGAAGGRDIAIWLTGFSGNKRGNAAQMEQLAAAGFLAVSFDEYQHGDRRIEPQEELGKRVFSNFRKYMWPIIGRSAEDASRVIDWAIAELGGGQNVRIAAAGIDRRIVAAAAVVATPEWTRPGTNIGPSTADAEAQAYYDKYNPLTHIGRYAHCPAITFQNGADDDHVPPKSAVEFAEKLKETYRACPQRLNVTNYPGVGHAVVDGMWSACFDWFKRWDRPARE
jgi:fermentation-respiration switch protein FrsA (DUF1100 family)